MFGLKKICLKQINTHYIIYSVYEKRHSRDREETLYFLWCGVAKTKRTWTCFNFKVKFKNLRFYVTGRSTFCCFGSFSNFVHVQIFLVVLFLNFFFFYYSSSFFFLENHQINYTNCYNNCAGILYLQQRCIYCLLSWYSVVVGILCWTDIQHT